MLFHPVAKQEHGSKTEKLSLALLFNATFLITGLSKKRKADSMNRFILILTLLMLAAAGCRKAADESNSLIGKWTFTEYYSSPGGPGQWQPVKPANQVIEFKEDGTFKSAKSFLSTATHYEIIDSANVKFTPAETPSGYWIMAYEIKSSALVMYAVNPACFEGCSYKFKRKSL